jgi:hypothetical protein
MAKSSDEQTGIPLIGLDGKLWPDPLEEQVLELLGLPPSSNENEPEQESPEQE